MLNYLFTLLYFTLKREYMTSEPSLSGEEEVVARPVIKEFSEAENQQAISHMTFYGSSKWHEMTKEWQKNHPLTHKIYTPEQIEESDRIIREANEEWKKRKAEEESQRLEADIRRQRNVDEANIKHAQEREKLIKKSQRKKKK